MRAYQAFVQNPPNSPENVKELVENKFNRKIDEEEPKLLSEFITLLGNEKETWGGRATMKACMEQFLSSKPKGQDYSVKDLQDFLFSPNQYVLIEGPDRPGPSKAVIPGAVGPSANPKTLKRPDHPSTSKAVIEGAVGQTSVPPANPKTLKVKIYMGSGWETRDFEKKPHRAPPQPPSLLVKLTINDGGESQKTNTQKDNWTPCWGEEFEFLLSNRKDNKLNVAVYDYHRLFKPNQFAGKFCRSVSELTPGIHVIPLSNEEGKPCSSAWLLVRFILE